LSAGISLIVGLGNPGAEYERTRHNAGEWFIEALAAQNQTILRQNNKFHGRSAQVKLHGQDCHLLIPTTFMNLSGKSLSALANFYKIFPNQILVAHDEIDLPVGEVKLKFDGGHGGHNGLRDIIQHLGSREFYRLRIGVGHPGNSNLVHDYVLSPPKKSEQILIEDAIQKAEQVVPLLVEGQIQKAMMELHTSKN